MSALAGDRVTGAALFAGDLVAANLAHLVFVRSPVAHGRITAIDVERARQGDGVLGVYRAADLVIGALAPVFGGDGWAQPALAEGVVRYVGERVVAVVAESLAQAIDASEQVVVDYEPLPVLTDPRQAARPGASLLFPALGTNIVLDLPAPKELSLFGEGEVIVRHECTVSRVAVAPLEGLAVLATPTPDGRLTLWLSTQSPHSCRNHIARALRCDPAMVRVITPAVGGGFGGKAGGAIGEYLVAAATARHLGRPVRYVEDRATNLATMHGRDVHQEIELHAQRDGRVTGLRIEVVADAGAYPGIATIEPMKMKLMASGPYRIAPVEFRGRSVVTNKAPTGAYRGPGRAEAASLLERAFDLLAADIGVDPIDVRRRNLLSPKEFPYSTPTGMTYDAGNYAALLDVLVSAFDYDELRRRQRERRAGTASLLGIGIASVVDSTAWAARSETAAVTVRPDGTVVVAVATASAGQDHAGAFASLVAEHLPVHPDAVIVREGDTNDLAHGDGSSGSRSVQIAGSAVRQAAMEVAAEARRLAAEVLEAAEEDIVVDGDRGFQVRGSPSVLVSLTELAAYGGDRLAARCLFEQANPTHPAAAHGAVVEVDAETGEVAVIRYVAVTDAGRIIDHAAAGAQVVGATVQGIAQALYEEVVYESDGSVRGTSLTEYLMPAASDVPMVEAIAVPSVSPMNPLGAKGIGEIGMVAAPVAVQNAVIDALAHLGVRHIDLPCTPERVWRAVTAATRASAMT